MATNDHDLLISIAARLDSLIEAFSKVSNGQGFPRCVERGERINRLEEDMETAREDIRRIDGHIAKNPVESGDVQKLQEIVSKIQHKRDSFDVWLMRSTWIILIAGIIKWAVFK